MNEILLAQFAKEIQVSAFKAGIAAAVVALLVYKLVRREVERLLGCR